jgi:hypothetical protein
MSNPGIDCLGLCSRQALLYTSGQLQTLPFLPESAAKHPDKINNHSYYHLIQYPNANLKPGL